MSQPLGPLSRSFYHAWVPHTNATHDQFIRELLGKVPQSRQRLPIIDEFVQTIEKNNQVEPFDQAVHQVQKYYTRWGDPQLFVTDFYNFADILNQIIQSPPRLYKANVNGVTIGEPVGVPIYLVLDLISNTSAAYTLFNLNSFNRAFQKVLDYWGKWLIGDQSASTLANEWFSEEGLAILEAPLGGLSFDQTFETDYPPDEKGGQRYNSWNSFFTRKFKVTNPPLRPIRQSPNPNVSFIYNSSESTILRTAYNIQTNDTFWLKTQNYSLYDILGGDLPNSLAQHAKDLVGGTAVQAFLSPADYHHWHVPIAGSVVYQVFEGTYYAVLPDDGAPPHDPDLEPGDPHGGLIRSQPWLSVAATRVVFIITPPENSPIKVAALIQIGMAEVSTCYVTYPGHEPGKPAPLEVGDDLGEFRFGGSSFVLIVKPNDGYKVVWQDIYNAPIRPGQARWVNSVVGQVWKEV